MSRIIIVNQVHCRAEKRFILKEKAKRLIKRDKEEKNHHNPLTLVFTERFVVTIHLFCSYNIHLFSLATITDHQRECRRVG